MNQDELHHHYAAAALTGLLAGRGKHLDAAQEERYVAQAHRLARMMVATAEKKNGQG